MAHYVNRGCGVWKLLLGCLEFLIKITGSLIACGKIYEAKGKERILSSGKPQEPRVDSSLQGVNQEEKVWSTLWSLELSSPGWEKPVQLWLSWLTCTRFSKSRCRTQRRADSSSGRSYPCPHFPAWALGKRAAERSLLQALLVNFLQPIFLYSVVRLLHSSLISWVMLRELF